MHHIQNSIYKSLWRDSAAKCYLHGRKTLSQYSFALQGKGCSVMMQLASMHGIALAHGSLDETIASITPVLKEHFGSEEDAEGI